MRAPKGMLQSCAARLILAPSRGLVALTAALSDALHPQGLLLGCRRRACGLVKSVHVEQKASAGPVNSNVVPGLTDWLHVRTHTHGRRSSQSALPARTHAHTQIDSAQLQGKYPLACSPYLQLTTHLLPARCRRMA